MNKKAVVVMAAGMWSRYWWLKQIDEFGPNGETILEYSVYDAIQAWFTDVVFVIREEFKDAFEDKIWTKIQDHIRVHYVYQEMSSYVPDTFSTEHRVKPWWTWHAILVAKEVVDCPFLVINADDWYWRSAFEQMWRYLEEECEEERIGIVWYLLEKTLSPYGTVNRGVCKVDRSQNILLWVKEHHKVGRNEKWVIRDEFWEELEEHTIVSMNFWWFHQNMLKLLEEKFHAFLEEFGHEPKKEFYIPTVCDELIQAQTHSCDVMVSEDLWCWVTYPDDKTYVRSVISAIVDWGEYPTKLR